jgi:hypothetical protein
VDGREAEEAPQQCPAGVNTPALSVLLHHRLLSRSLVAAALVKRCGGGLSSPRHHPPSPSSAMRLAVALPAVLAAAIYVPSGTIRGGAILVKAHARRRRFVQRLPRHSGESGAASPRASFGHLLALAHFPPPVLHLSVPCLPPNPLGAPPFAGTPQPSTRSAASMTTSPSPSTST